ncbi:phosphoglycolate phosphatase [Raphidocelis subcapitata]|uniref:Phosphoglycolate phosphatase n=1 Tax=Raphidocelis subcapitata TaxID=307507 RepID=A0A2V0NSR2_9CHLO|nr:phosphoglycolate phosphatase [Raphidocelis subcapitata]|eukprot:GBF88610.1 phosphoglycolate phosphatase [Raphidocelis subcapitata]
MQLRATASSRAKTGCRQVRSGTNGRAPLAATAAAAAAGARRRGALLPRAGRGADAGPSSSGSSDCAVRGIIFDVDGVLCSTEHLSREAAAEVMRRLHGLAVAPDEFIPYGGQGEARFLGGVAEKYGVAGFDLAAATQLFLDVYINTYTRGPAAAGIGFPGAVELVRSCRAAGLATAVASSAERVKVEANLRAAGFGSSDFDAVVSGTGLARNKPAPDIFLNAAAALGLDPSACVVLEDTAAGIAAGRAAGCRVVGVATTMSAEEVEGEGPDAVVPHVGALRVDDLLSLRRRAAAL